jgi:hypothetical protein
VKAGLSKTKAWFHRILSRVVPQRSRGMRPALHERSEQRVGSGDLYRERVTMLDTGEVVHDVEEPLSGHGR